MESDGIVRKPRRSVAPFQAILVSQAACWILDEYYESIMVGKVDIGRRERVLPSDLQGKGVKSHDF
jgi:hypothetical protein